MNTLFDLSECEKLKTPSQSEFETNNLGLLCTFPEIVKKSIERLNKDVFSMIEPRSRDNKLAPTAISGFIRGYLFKMYPELCGAATKTRFCMKMNDSTKVYVKKLNEKYRPMWGKDTIDNTKIIHQLTNSETESIGNVFIGYTSSKDNASVTGVYAVCIDGDELVWLSDLNSLASMSSKAIAKEISTTKETTIKPGIVKIKKAGNGE